jgi:hypothetical protein
LASKNSGASLIPKWRLLCVSRFTRFNTRDYYYYYYYYYYYCICNWPFGCWCSTLK